MGYSILTRCLLTEDYDKTRYEIETPLTASVDYNKVRGELGVPEYVDSKSFLIERGLVTIWAAMKAGSLREVNPAAEQLKIENAPIPVLFFGEGAVKLLCQEANKSNSPLYREIDDIDLITS